MASLNPLQGALGLRRAAHLLRRTTYRFTKAKVDEMAGQTAAQALGTLLQVYPQQLSQPYYDDPATPAVAEKTTWIMPPGQALPAEDFVLRRRIMTWWIDEAFRDAGIGHKMTMFFHQYMIVAANAYGNTHFYDYLALMRWGALGNFKKLAYKLVTDNCMLRYLNNNVNTKNNPNENFAREYFELFTIAKGPQVAPDDYTNYTEDDIVQAAKVLTGFRNIGLRTDLDPETGIPRGGVNVAQHDTSDKKFSPRFNNTVIKGAKTNADMWRELSDFVNMIFAQPETARTLCRRLYRYFVGTRITPEIESDIITPMAATLVLKNWEVKPVLEQLLQSQHFFDADDSKNGDEILGGMIKSPLELAYQSISFFDIKMPASADQTSNFIGQFWSQAVLDRMFSAAGLPLFQPSDVAGYPAYYQEPDFTHQWFNSSTIIARYKLPAMLLTGTRQIGGGPNTSIGVKLNIAQWLRDSGFVKDPSDPYVLVQELLNYLLPLKVDNDRFTYFYDKVFLDGLPPADWTYEWEDYIKTGKETEVKLALERLIKAIMYSPEYQTF